MKRMSSYRFNRGWLVVLLTAVCFISIAQAARPGWPRTALVQGWLSQEVDLRITGGASIKAVSYPPTTVSPLLDRWNNYQKTAPKTTIRGPGLNSQIRPLAESPNEAVTATVIDSPPLNGFVPWIAIVLTNERSDELELDAVPQFSVIGKPLAAEPNTGYGIGIFDTGAGAHILSAVDAVQTGLYDYTPSQLTESAIDVTGVTGSASVWVSQPLGLFIDGINKIDPNGLTLDETTMVGQTNVSIGVGDFIDSPNVPTAIGSPLSVFLTSVIHNDNQITIVRDGEEFTGPEMTFYELDAPNIPDYPNSIPLELRPSGSVAVQYFPNILDPFGDDFGAPMSPSVMTSFLPSQSLFFASSVDVTHKGKSALDKDGFMLDTGAEVSVISEAIAARLGLNAANAEFEVEIVGVSGDSIMAPGFIIDSLDITATPEWLSFTNVPVIMLDVDSPEGGTLDGIIGMNLFTNFNLVIHGGGLPDFGGHSLDFEPIAPRPVGDIAPGIGDGIVDLRDIAALARSWLATPESPQWNPAADIAPVGAPDGVVNFLDFAVMAENWLATATTR
jgi:hypothetical protein